MSSNPLLSRRSLLTASATSIIALGAGAWGWLRLPRTSKYQFQGSIIGANARVGHLLREGADGTPTHSQTINTVIVGGGIAGLSAAWWLKKHGHDDFVLLEMNDEVGGNSTSGSNSISAYPWGAHYVPFPGEDAKYAREFFEEVGIIKGYDKGLPIYNEYFVCADPDERLLFQGEWHDGLIPQQGIPADERRQYGEFFDFVHRLKTKVGSDGKPLFTIPIDLSSKDPDYLKLDQITMAQFMSQRGWISKHLNWYVNYCCRDDYGYGHDKVSAWAGIHYFAARTGRAANADSSSVLTWPEGNGFLVEQLRKSSAKNIRSNHIVTSIEEDGLGCLVTAVNTKDKSCSRYVAKNVIYAGPRFTANKVIKNYQSPPSPVQSPWLVANISVSEIPNSRGAPTSWDNVSFYSQSLGYIVANHQDLKVQRKERVLTYYLPLDHVDAKQARIAAFQRNYEEWLDIIVPDMEKMHPGITNNILHVDLWVWGHGMTSPGVGFLWGEDRERMLKPHGRVHFANSDMSGISIFEEAQYRGVLAAQAIMRSTPG